MELKICNVVLQNEICLLSYFFRISHNNTRYQPLYPVMMTNLNYKMSHDTTGMPTALITQWVLSFLQRSQLDFDLVRKNDRLVDGGDMTSQTLWRMPLS